MNSLSAEKQILVLSALAEGNSIRSIERMTGVNRNTIMTLLKKAGEKAKSIMDSEMVNIQSNYIQCDEIWCFVAKKQKNLTMEERYYSNNEVGDQYTFVAMDSETKLVPCFLVGKRTSENTQTFMSELRTRVDSHFQLSTDSFQSYHGAVKKVFKNDVDYGQIHKEYSNAEMMNEKRYSPANIIRTIITPLIGEPKKEFISTSHIERQNLTMRMGMRRFTRLTNAFSKKLENLKHAVALHFFHYNFIREHKTLKVTPAMASGIAKTFWTWEKFLGVESVRKVAA